jgi:hypothetical protein
LTFWRDYSGRSQQVAAGRERNRNAPGPLIDGGGIAAGQRL